MVRIPLSVLSEKRKMRIGIEGRVLASRGGGIGRYAVNLVRGLLKLSVEEYHDVEFVIFTAPQTDRGLLNGVQANFCDRFRGVKSTMLRSGLLLSIGTVFDHIDLFHGLDQASFPFWGKRSKHVVTLHDVIACVFPHLFPWKLRLVLQAAFATIRRQVDLVIVPSESAKEDVAQYLGVERQRIVIIPHGVEDRFRPIGDPARSAVVRQKYGLPHEYILFVGVLEPRKNIPFLMQGFSRLLAEKVGYGLTLVIAGGNGWGLVEIHKAVQSLGLQEHVVFPGFIDEEDLPDLYRGARLFVYPSLYEGFGLPILEAMACGVPVITSNTSSMPEVAGDAALLIDPLDVEGLASAMASVLIDKELKETLQQKGMARASQFSWETTARKTLESYHAL